MIGKEIASILVTLVLRRFTVYAAGRTTGHAFLGITSVVVVFRLQIA